MIELLVVIAIIGVLASIVLGSLNSARTKGGDAAVKANLDTIRTQAQVYYEKHGLKYDDMCADTTILAAFNAAQTAVGTAGNCIATTTVAGVANGYVVFVPLKEDASHKWCVDDTGFAGVMTNTADVAHVGSCN